MLKLLNHYFSRTSQDPDVLQKKAPDNSAVPPAADALTTRRPAFGPQTQSTQRHDGLRAILLEAIAPVHARVAEHDFFAAIKNRQLGKTQLLVYLADQEHVIATLEKALIAYKNEVSIEAICSSKINNRQGLAALDAAALGAGRLPPPSFAACQLAARIAALGENQNYAGIAVHAWVQYGAMLNGGQQLASGLRKLYFQTPMALFTFTRPAAQLRAQYANRINTIPFDMDDVDELCTEARAALLANAQMLDAAFLAHHCRDAASVQAIVTGP